MLIKLTKVFATIIISIIGCFGCTNSESTEVRVKRLSDELSENSGKGNLSKMKELLSQGGEINGKCCGVWPPINAAIKNDQTEAVTFLINNGADVNADAKEGSPLLLAIQKKNFAVVKLLLEKGAKPNLKSSIDSVTTISEAEKQGDKEILELLKKYSERKGIQ
jgi:uncharacterized protein